MLTKYENGSSSSTPCRFPQANQTPPLLHVVASVSPRRSALVSFLICSLFLFSIFLVVVSSFFIMNKHYSRCRVIVFWFFSLSCYCRYYEYNSIGMAGLIYRKQVWPYGKPYFLVFLAAVLLPSWKVTNVLHLYYSFKYLIFKRFFYSFFSESFLFVLVKKQGDFFSNTKHSLIWWHL